MIVRRFSLGIALVVALVAGPGCESRPKAPELRNGPVYQNKELGFRFLVPDGWTQLGNAYLPSGPIDKEICLVQFLVPSTEGASMEVLCFDRTYAADLAAYHGSPSQAISNWQLQGEATPIEVEGAKGERYTFSADMPKGGAMIKDVTCFTRGERIYSFVGLARESDARAREQLHSVVRSLVWN